MEMANLTWNVLFSLTIAILSVVHGFLTDVIDEAVTEDAGHFHLLNETQEETEVKGKAIVQLQEVG
jgi:hypothetical protein